MRHAWLKPKPWIPTDYAAHDRAVADYMKRHTAPVKPVPKAKEQSHVQ